MAHKAKSFKVDVENKVIVLYNNVERPKSEKDLVDFYLSQGYTPKIDIKKPTVTVKQMRKELAADEETLKAFNAAYESKDKENGGFFAACKIYTAWKKDQKKDKK